jgi:hypothetical protein
LTADSKYLYFHQEGSRGVRRMDLVTRQVSFVPGMMEGGQDVDGALPGVGKVSDPYQLASDGAGGLFFSNFFNLRWIKP